VSGPAGRLRDREWKRFLRAPEHQLAEELYVPALSVALRYDRCCAYFSSSVLSAAAIGFGRLIEHLEALGAKAPRPSIRLLVNEELTVEDVRALLETGDAGPLERILGKRFKTPSDALQLRRLQMLGWLVKSGYLDVRVGVMRQTGGILHAKFGLVSDRKGDAIVFRGSANESESGMRANYESLEVSTSWKDKEATTEYSEEFERLWANDHPDVLTVTLPEAIRQKLIRFAPKEPPISEPVSSVELQKAAMRLRFLAEAPFLPNGEFACDATAMVDQWPHQRHVVDETSHAWPDGRLLCDEVGMGKTLEAVLVLRRLIAGRGVKRALILVPAGLTRQWQAELREKGGLRVPRLDGTINLVWPDGKERRASSFAEALEEDVLILSRETARTRDNLQVLLQANPWDLVILDEAHAARRGEQKAQAFNTSTLLLGMLRTLQLCGRARGILLLSATPMQTSPWEPWDLLSVLGEGGKWLSDFDSIERYYDATEDLRGGALSGDDAIAVSELATADPRFPAMPSGECVPCLERLAQRLEFAAPSETGKLADWLRQGSPLSWRMHRNTRNTLRAYHKLGLIDKNPPSRVVEDIEFDYQDAQERRVYEAVRTYIEQRFAALEQEKAGKGFVMTIYRRRASSSPFALLESLKRRRNLLWRFLRKEQVYGVVDAADFEEFNLYDDLPGDWDLGTQVKALPSTAAEANAELEALDPVLHMLERLEGTDSKLATFFEALKQITDDGRSALVFTEYTDTMDYLRDELKPLYGSAKLIACYSGRGGEWWDGESWVALRKDQVTKMLRDGKLKVLVCTDAASEGLNLQAAGAVVNYDLPWNPSRVEQRIGRIDRIGQKYGAVLVVNLFLHHSVDQQVYTALRRRCGLFEHFVGTMQPVLARATASGARGWHGRLLLGQDHDLSAIESESNAASSNRLALAAYAEAGARIMPVPMAVAERGDYWPALEGLGRTGAFTVRTSKDGRFLEVGGRKFSKLRFSDRHEALEHDPTLLPLNSLEPEFRRLVEAVSKTSGPIPLVIGSYAQGGFRASVAFWAGATPIAIESYAQLQKQIEEWDGAAPEGPGVSDADRMAREEAKERVRFLIATAESVQASNVERQLSAARFRLRRELGRTLVAISNSADNPNQTWYQLMKREGRQGERLRACFERLGSSYVNWEPNELLELASFLDALTPARREGRNAMAEIGAALEDPRWQACMPSA
jgi:superfamily II DNA or RNA helicase